MYIYFTFLIYIYIYIFVDCYIFFPVPKIVKILLTGSYLFEYSVASYILDESEFS